ncbi:MAG: hypothetical protein LUP94_02835 [Candidatus Methanomethylicus sp.]|nr:hypothetical protein [Candidatus Methanomethylicus sp.]
MATEILSQYEYRQIDLADAKVIDNEGMPVEEVVEVQGGSPILVEYLVRPGEVEFKLRLDLKGPDIDVSGDFIKVFQKACNLEPTNINDVKYGRVRTKYFRITPRKSACLKFD